MTTGFDQQPTTFGAFFKAAPKPQIVGAKLGEPQKPNRPAPAEPRSFERAK